MTSILKRRNIPVELQAKLHLSTLKKQGNHHGKTIWAYEELTPPQEYMRNGFEGLYEQKAVGAVRNLSTNHTGETEEELLNKLLERRAQIHRQEKVRSCDARLGGICHHGKKL